MFATGYVCDYSPIRQKQQDVGNYTLHQTLGAGTTGKVKLAEHKTTHRQFAVKIITKATFESNPQIGDKIYREIALMRLMDHPHLLKMHDILESQNRLYLVLEYAPHGELFDYLLSRGTLRADESLHFFRQIIYGLDYLHSNSICHRDLKLENILLDDRDNVKIADFGFARWMKSNVADTSCGSAHYTAPEVISGLPYDGRAADVWSCGVLLYTLLSGRFPFDDSSIRALLAKICAGQYRMPDFPDAVRDLISKLLTVDPKQRIKLERIKRHAAFRIGIPRGYCFPAPLPLPSISDPIDPSQLDEPLLNLLFHVGYKTEKELYDDLRSTKTTTAKSFCVLLSSKATIDGLPWPESNGLEMPSAASLDFLVVPEDDDVTLGFERRDSLSPQLGESSVYSLAERAVWDPVCTPGFGETETVSCIRDLCSPLEEVMETVQAVLAGIGYDWFYPHDSLLIARNQASGSDVTVNVEYGAPTGMKLVVRLLRGDAMEFNAIVGSLAQAVNGNAQR
jgi:BR serine/threonine kinase